MCEFTELLWSLNFQILFFRWAFFLQFAHNYTKNSNKQTKQFRKPTIITKFSSMWVANFILSSSSTDGLKPLSTFQLRTVFVNDLPVWPQKPCMSLLCSCHLAVCVSLTTLVPDVIGLSLVRITAVSADGSKGKYCDTEIVSTHTKGWWVQLMANVVTALPGNFEHIETIVKSNLVINCQCPGWRRPSHSFPVSLCRIEWMDAVCVWYGGDVCIHNLIETQYTKLCMTV